MITTEVVDETAKGVQVDDLGESYRVSVAGMERVFADGARHCDERARAAAVFIAVTLELFAPEAPGARPSPPALSASPPPPEEPLLLREHWTVDLEAGGQIALAPVRDLPVAAGGALRWAIGKRQVSLVLGVSGPHRVLLPLAEGQAQLLRVPIDFDFRGGIRRGRWEAAGELGLALTVLSAEGQGLPMNTSANWVAVGLRASLLGRLWLAPRIAVMAAVEALFSQTRDLALDSTVIGTVPPLWLGALLGLVVRIH